MNNRQLAKLEIPGECYPIVTTAIAKAIAEGHLRGRTEVAKTIKQIAQIPEQYTTDPYFGKFATALIEAKNYKKPQPIPYKTWGPDGIDQACHAQMQHACSIPVAKKAALMGDAHLGYGLPIGGVLACENAVIPFCVGVDIACRMKLSILDIPTKTLDKLNLYKEAIDRGTNFGVGGEWPTTKTHPVLDQDWNITRITRENKDKAQRQLGTSGSGNHFVDFGILTINPGTVLSGELEDIAPGEYVAIMSHSGSRGAGAAVCATYNTIAQHKLPRRHAEFGRLAWLGLDTQEGQEYWAAMNLMGDYAAANHDVIHKSLTKLLGAEILGGVENHHNFAWREVHEGRDLIVHRKGATPAGVGVLGVIPGSMGTPAYVVRGLGSPDSLCSASHGAGRVMSRTAGREKYNWNAVRKDLEKKGITVLSAGADESPGVYKDIEQVMRDQTDLVEVLACFEPRIVKMSDDGRNED